MVVEPPEGWPGGKVELGSERLADWLEIGAEHVVRRIPERGDSPIPVRRYGREIRLAVEVEAHREWVLTLGRPADRWIPQISRRLGFLRSGRVGAEEYSK